MPSDEEVAQLRRELDQVKLKLARLEGRVDTALADEPASNGRYPKAPETSWYDVEDWVITFMGETLERRASNTRRWCPQWYDHPEVALRFRLLYETYNQVFGKLNAISYSAWILEHLDPHLDAIFSEDGPFASCSPERHSRHRGLTVVRNSRPELAGWGPRPRRLDQTVPTSDATRS